MAPAVKNNLAATQILNQLNQNNSELSRRLARVSTDMKIVSAQDDASQYAISERMRVKIRALDQDLQNVQNGSSMLKNASGGVERIVDILREMKAKAINAANDSNTDEDRQTIQKEITQLMKSINDVALGTEYNGKRLIDGTYDPRTEYADIPGTALQVAQALMYSLDKTTLSGEAALNEAINYASGGKFKTKDALISQFMNDLNSSSSATDFLEDYCDIILGNADTGAITGKDAGGDTIKTAESIVPEKIAVSSWGLPTSDTTINGLTIHWPTAGANGSTFTAAEKHILKGLNSDWIEQCINLVTESFGLSFTDDGTTVNEIDVTFENNSSNNRLAAVEHSYSLSTGKATSLTLIINMNYYDAIDTTSEDGDSSNSGSIYLDRTLAHEFTHAVMAANIDNFSKLPKYIKEGTAELVHGIDDVRSLTDLLGRKDDLAEVFAGNRDDVSDEAYSAGYMLLRYLAKQGQDSVNAANSQATVLSRKYNPLVIQDGTQAGQHNNFYIKDMQTNSLTAGKIFKFGTESASNLIKANDLARYNALDNDPDKQKEWLETLRAAANMTVDDISVTTVKNANIAIRVLDGALEYALDNATTIGAYLTRLEYDADNVTISRDNVQASESVIRDVDMAKETTAYTKANVLAQAAQSMLAQANQNSANILSLLQ